MKSILQQLYDGELFPAEQCHSKTQDVKELTARNYDHYNNFMSKLESVKPELIKEFIQIIDEHLETLYLQFSETFSESFKEGFRLGARMLIEAYENDSHENTY